MSRVTSSPTKSASANGPRGWLAPSFSVDSQPRFGHPIILGGALAAELAGFTPDQPLRDLRRRAGPTWSIEVQTEAILDNLDTPDVIASLGLLFPGQKEVLSFTAPKQPGQYDYVCTFPGHWRLMKGVMTVVGAD